MDGSVSPVRSIGAKCADDVVSVERIETDLESAAECGCFRPGRGYASADPGGGPAEDLTVFANEKRVD
jgi:hypothetical protein